MSPTDPLSICWTTIVGQLGTKNPLTASPIYVCDKKGLLQHARHFLVQKHWKKRHSEEQSFSGDRINHRLNSLYTVPQFLQGKVQEQTWISKNTAEEICHEMTGRVGGELQNQKCLLYTIICIWKTRPSFDSGQVDLCQSAAAEQKNKNQSQQLL